MTNEPRTRSRRSVLATLGIGSTGALAGCLGDGGPGIVGDPEYETGAVDDADGEERDPEEMTAAESLAEQEIDEGVTDLGALSLETHEFVLEDDYRGSTVQGVVEHTGSDRIDTVEIRVRVYNDDGDHLGRYLDSTGDLDGGQRWEFEVILLEAPDDIAEYDVTVLGTPT
ncbi:FxLYD domain-containing protein [Natronolimnohabitans innermongolicus]|uniref:Uncharacterized protein n=1 Tax=Natronolimnohabitans innermongolicus JCM 12255 TaxID=1227499 RepID=L9XAU3_9EURY|nr:FxLYD domain-containing protein [Natronolimnohabitans innermongolicus]ELY58762.1 hypothetical protein C493_06327 [Natronolimnohabitans innermongolicus JCM 12255]